MPANLSPEYSDAEKEYKAAKTPDEKLLCLQKMLSAIPKHKGTEKMQADLKRRIAQSKEKQDAHSKKKGLSFRVKPEGGGQIALIGPPNSGKSALLNALTHAEPEIADYPFTTREPMPGMTLYKDLQIQLVDLPPVSADHCESFVFDNIRGSDGALVVLDLAASDPVSDLEQILELLDQKKIRLIPPEETPEVTETGEVSIRSILVFNKSDLDPDGELLELIKEMLEIPLPIEVVSTKVQDTLNTLPKKLFDLLHIIRVYSKHPGKPPDMDAPFSAPIGTTVLEFAALVHKDFAEHFKSARIWGSAKFDGQVVQKDHVLEDEDIVELSI